MEIYINKRVNDITYQSEILHFVQNRPRVLSEAKDELILDIEDVKDLIRPNNLRSLLFRKLWAN